MKPETKLRKLCDKAGIELEEKGNGHYHIKGKLLVNYWPNSKNQTCYIAGTTQGKKSCTPEQAVKMSQEPPNGITKIASRKGHYRQQRLSMHRAGKNSCHWCDAPLTIDTSTLEHIIPLAIGGLDLHNNYTLACESCNKARGCGMPELEEDNAG